MCGGEESAFKRAQPIFSCYGKNMQLNGEAGKGQHTKMMNQIVLAGNMVGVVEGLMYASKMGLDLLQAIETLKAGAASSVPLTVLGPRMIARNFDPGFYVEHYIKDLEIALEECLNHDLCLPNLALVKQFYVALKAQGGAKMGTQALIKVLEQMNNHQISK